MMKIFTRAAVLALLSMVLSGCGTVLARQGSTFEADDDYYKGTQASAKLLTFQLEGEKSKLTMLCGITLVCPVVMVALLPADFVIDTAMLPYDLYQQFDGFPQYQYSPEIHYIPEYIEPAPVPPSPGPVSAAPVAPQDAQ